MTTTEPPRREPGAMLDTIELDLRRFNWYTIDMGTSVYLQEFVTPDQIRALVDEVRRLRAENIMLSSELRWRERAEQVCKTHYPWAFQDAYVEAFVAAKALMSADADRAADASGTEE